MEVSYFAVILFFLSVTLQLLENVAPLTCRFKVMFFFLILARKLQSKVNICHSCSLKILHLMFTSSSDISEEVISCFFSVCTAIALKSGA